MLATYPDIYAAQRQAVGPPSRYIIAPSFTGASEGSSSFTPIAAKLDSRLYYHKYRLDK